MEHIISPVMLEKFGDHLAREEREKGTIEKYLRKSGSLPVGRRPGDKRADDRLKGILASQLPPGYRQLHAVGSQPVFYLWVGTSAR